MNRITKSKDGIPRITLKLETRLGAYDMAVHIISRLRYESDMNSWLKDNETTEERDKRIENAIKSKMSGMSDKQILDLISDSILLDGTENPYYSVSDDGYSAAVDFLTGYLTRKYRGFADVSSQDITK